MGISEVQKNLATELGMPMTYLEARLLLADLGLTVKEKARTAPVVPQNRDADRDGGAAAPKGKRGVASEAGGRGVSVEIDRLARAGAVASGSVRFSDGTNGAWEIDAMGRLALKTDKQNYSPSAEDIRSFQEEIGNQLRRRGF
jgi:hypothetical protein